MDTNNVVDIRTVQAMSFKILIEALKDLLTDVNIEIDHLGLRVLSMDSSHCVLVHLKLDADKFEFFACKKNTTIGLNMIFLHKIIKTINSNDVLTLFIEEEDENHLGIKIENSDKNTKTTYKLTLYDLDNVKISMEPEKFNTVITLPSTDFQKICRDMHQISEFAEIRNSGNQLVFSCKGDFCYQETVLSDTGNGIYAIQNSNPDEIVQGVFSLKYLALFTKCTNLCNIVELLLKNDWPIIVQYQVASLGSIKLCLGPRDQSAA